MKSPTRINQRKLALFALVLATSLTFAACTPNPTPTTTNTLPAQPTPEVAETAPQVAASPATQTMLSGTLDPVTGVRTVEIEAGSFFYKPDMIRVQKGEKVKLVMTSVDMMHDLIVDELSIKVPVAKSGTTATAEFTATETGSFEYYCSVGQHRANGQVGTLIIE